MKEKGDPVRDRLGKHRGCARRRQARKNKKTVTV
jgi:hypothetical protein